ncbi:MULTISPECIES: DUF4245 domain-containing protein [Streptomyces]|uniref:DUF4245 domain-containing protein n=1 Tax=Streptomyces cadmiisoli TaxID=2184053 RepID=A0A2Z4IYX4_9ACTN|nr:MULTISPECIES: DUF4245 domain-containing protein [Streptomyces]AWW37798.1 DUF4245 domain-containing protein [Streptomyces cadmiisoli]
MAGTNGKQKTARGMVLSLGVCVLAAGFVYIFLPRDGSAPDLKRVDYRVELLTARRAAAYAVAAPEGLPQSWKATSVRFDGTRSDEWHLGFHTPDGEYVALEQSAGKRSAVIEEASQGARETDVTEDIGGRTWVRYTGGRYDALVLAEGEQPAEATTVVAGTGSFEQLAQVARALRTG